jgi:hypothetical protein
MRKQSPTSEQTMVRSSTAEQASPTSTVGLTFAKPPPSEAVAAEAMKTAPASEPAKAASAESASAKSSLCLGRSSGQGDGRHQNQHFAFQASRGWSRSSTVHG